MSDDNNYNSPFQTWYEVAGVRAGERRMLGSEYELADIYYPPELAPVTNHPFVIKLGSEVRRRLLIRHLYIYLDAIERLEHEIVNTVVYKIARNKLLPDIPVSMRMDAYKIYTDEAYHMLYSADLLEQIKTLTGIEPILAPPSFSLYVNKISQELGGNYLELIITLLSVVTETMISSILLEIPKDKRVVETVRNLIRDHAEDEGRHSKFFSMLFERYWPKLTVQERRIMGPLLPKLIVNFTRPNLAAITKVLMAEDLNEDTARGIVEECYTESSIEKSAANAAQVSVSLFNRFGVMKDSKTKDEFLRTGLWNPK